MIRSIRHEGLRRLFEEGDTSGVHSEHVEKLHNILSALNTARVDSDMDLPDLQLHRLYGDGPNYWAVTVRANWRVSFRLSKNGPWDVDYFDYPKGRSLCL
jgi:toxin HigB-1